VGDDDVDFDLFFYEPGKLDLKTERTVQDLPIGNRDCKVGPLKLRQTEITTALKKDSGVIVLVYSRLKAEPSPKVFWHAGGSITEVASGAGTCYVYLMPTVSNSRQTEFATADKLLVFKGEAGPVQFRGKEVTMSLGSGGMVRFGGRMLSAKAATTERVAQ